ncbi:MULTISPECIES: integrin alpha [unclassified Streptomyces]
MRHLRTTLATAAPSGLDGDFNGDGYRDVAIAAPIAKVSGKTGAG